MADVCGGWNQDDWYRDGEEQIHFFPFPKVLLWTSGKKILAQVEAWGGQRAKRGEDYGRMRPQLTTPGGYEKGMPNRSRAGARSCPFIGA